MLMVVAVGNWEVLAAKLPHELFEFLVVHCYRMEGNLGGGKIWRIHWKNILAEENLASSLVVENFGKFIGITL